MAVPLLTATGPQAAAAAEGLAQQARVAQAWGSGVPGTGPGSLAQQLGGSAYNAAFRARAMGAPISESAFSAAGAAFQQRAIPTAGWRPGTWVPSGPDSGVRPGDDFRALIDLLGPADRFGGEPRVDPYAVLHDWPGLLSSPRLHVRRGRRWVMVDPPILALPPDQPTSIMGPSGAFDVRPSYGRLVRLQDLDDAIPEAAEYDWEVGLLSPFAPMAQAGSTWV